MSIKKIILLLAVSVLCIGAADEKLHIGLSKGLHLRDSVSTQRVIAEKVTKTPRQALEDLGIFSVFLKAMNVVGLESMLDGTQKVTIFAPNDHVFEKMPQDKLEAMFEPKKRIELHRMLMNHIVIGTHDRSDLVDGARLRSYNYQHDLVISTLVNGIIQRVSSVMILPFDLYHDKSAVYAVNGIIKDSMLQERKPQIMEFSFDEVFDFEY
jgi:hypothetical protein